VDFPYLIYASCLREITSLISMEKTSERSWWDMPFLLPQSSRGVIVRQFAFPGVEVLDVGAHG
jgi:hypothetical protein